MATQIVINSIISFRMVCNSEPLVHSISVKFNGAAVPGSPFNAIVHDCQQSPVSGSELRMTSVARGARFVVHSKGSDQSVHVKATGI